MVRPDGKPARTRYETLAVYGGRALLRLELDTGRTHQIRVHMAPCWEISSMARRIRT